MVQNTYIGQAMGLFGIVLVLLLASRAVFLFPILAAHNYFCVEKLPFRHAVVAWCALRCVLLPDRISLSGLVLRYQSWLTAPPSSLTSVAAREGCVKPTMWGECQRVLWPFQSWQG